MKFRTSLSTLCVVGLGWTPALSSAQEETTDLDEYVVEDEVGDDLNVLPTEPIKSVFGFNKSILETPRSVSSVSSDVIDTYQILNIDDVATFIPGTFTSSFFGVQGALDVRGTPGETYFRGVRRMENNGNFPTPIGATDRIDIVRGPASPIAGPAKVGGYLNFVPRTARAQTGQYLTEFQGEIRATVGSWEKRLLEAEVGGPMNFDFLGGRPAGFWLYLQNENSDSYYNNSLHDQSLAQASFNIDLSNNLRTEFGVMYQDWQGTENAGWNRVTQELVDNGTYITGRARDIDLDNDGLISGAEARAASPDALNAFCLPALPNGVGIPVACQEAIARNQPALSLEPGTVGTTTLDGSQVNIAPNDVFDTEVITAYFDLIYELENGWTLTNKAFFDKQKAFNTNLYGFAQTTDGYVFEDQIILSGDFAAGPLETAFQFSPSVRYTDTKNEQDFTYEYFDRVDLSTGVFDSRSNRLLSIVSDDEPATQHRESTYTQYGLAALFDNTLFDKLHFLAGVRYDWITFDTGTLFDVFSLPTDENDNTVTRVEDTVSGVSFTLSVSYDLPYGITPYFTYSEQRTLITGQGAELDVANAANGDIFGVSDLMEAGVKASMLDGRLFAAISIFEQERVDFSAQDLVTNNTTNTRGIELEARWLPPIEGLTLFSAATIMDVRNVLLDPDGDGVGNQFSWCGAADVPFVPPQQIFGGAVQCLFSVDGDEEGRGGIPDFVVSGGASYQVTDNIRTSFSVIHAASVKAGISGAIQLPSYTVLNLAASYETERWRLSAFVDNVNDARYFRSNFPDLFGNSTVKPELPINWNLQLAYKF